MLRRGEGQLLGREAKCQHGVAASSAKGRRTPNSRRRSAYGGDSKVGGIEEKRLVVLSSLERELLDGRRAVIDDLGDNETERECGGEETCKGEGEEHVENAKTDEAERQSKSDGDERALYPSPNDKNTLVSII